MPINLERTFKKTSIYNSFLENQNVCARSRLVTSKSFKCANAWAHIRKKGILAIKKSVRSLPKENISRQIANDCKDTSDRHFSQLHKTRGTGSIPFNSY